ncbi:hypothetical protein [Pontiella sulfatireligans]|uniref:DUF560 domain-containing protein n=1 Tax=Pontiella sulfatireligans TaxID=2750658 RepID=A0A6C2URN1_9BACT|nr:hypothetical protein [Pontiella sulfatireligans]VGO22613.1 hypothetical protein SCARR_04698 [Pontiella sulfatireligans]
MMPKAMPLIPLLVLLCAGAPAESTNQPPVAVWDATALVSTGVGYRNNVLRSSIATEDSAFFLSSVDASVMRLSESGAYFLLYLFGEDIRYFNAPSVDYEQIFSCTAQFVQPVGSRNEAGLEANYLYQHTIVDASVNEVDLQRVLVRGHGATLRPHWRHKAGDWEAKLEGVVLRQIYESELDDYWESGGRISLARNYGNRSMVSVGFLPMLRTYDTREQYDQSGNAEPGTDLTYSLNEADGEWRHYWDAERHWRTASKLSYLANRDNGSGYFDYDRLQLRQQVRWENDVWNISGIARFGWYLYKEQYVDNERRERSYVTLSYRIERRFGKHWMLFTAGEHEWNMSNDPLDDYRSWMASGGAGYEF